MSGAKQRFQDWADLKRVKREIEQRAKLAAEQEAAERAAQQRRQMQQDAFRLSLGPVEPLKVAQRSLHRPAQPLPIPVQSLRDDEAVIREALSDEWDATSLLHTDESLSFRRPGIGPDVVRKLRQGAWSVQSELDLHDLRTDEARQTLGTYVRECHKQGLRCVRIIHGKGLGSPGKVSVLRPKVQSWLIQKNQVLAFVQATPAQGGAGALVVLLQAGDARHARGSRPV